MDFALTDDQKTTQQLSRRFAREQILPIAAKLDATGEVPEDLVRRFHELDLHALQIPEEYGGCGTPLRTLDFMIALEELAWADGGTTVHLMSQAMCYASILNAGTEEQKQRFLPRFVGKTFYQGAMAATEPDAGSNVYAMRSVAKPDGKGGYRLSGEKCFITNAPTADLFVIWATVDPTAGPAGIRGFLVEKGARGLSVGKPYEKLGVRASGTAPVYMDDIEVPAENVLGGARTACFAMRRMLDQAKTSGSAVALGIARAGLEAAKANAKQRRTFGRPLIRNQAVSHRLVNMAICIDQCRFLVHRAAWTIDQGHDPHVHACMAKIACGEMVRRMTLDALHLFGGYGFIEDNPVAKLYRDAPIFDIWEGSGEMQREMLAARL
jgi:alkylation response protein AidB-like acyl-CoA dehydrogenase